MTSTRVTFIAMVLTVLVPLTAVIGEAWSESDTFSTMVQLGLDSAGQATTGGDCAIDEDLRTGSVRGSTIAFVGSQ